MPQSIFIQVGQCGNQVGFRFWNSLMREYHAYKETLNINEIEYFFKYSDSATPDEALAARALLLDMEEGVIKEGLRSNLRPIFNTKQILTDVSGSGNNWARGNKFYGKVYKEKIENLIRQQVEACDRLDGFLFTFSLGGGTGSGLGTSVLEHVKTVYPSVKRIVYPVYPSTLDDVITSPYNALLSNNILSKCASLIVTFDNEALTSIVSEIDKNQKKFRRCISRGIVSPSSSQDSPSSLPFDGINDLIASVISDMTSTTRLPGSLNLDLSDVVTNITPYKALNYSIPSSSPFILVPEDAKLECLFSDLFTNKHALTKCDMNVSTPLAYIICARGPKITVMDVQSNLNRLFKNPKIGTIASIDESRRKIGVCNYAPASRNLSLLKITNTPEISVNLTGLKERFKKMYQKKAHLHHYIDENVGDSEFQEALSNISDIIQEYRELKNSTMCLDPPRLNLV